MKIAIRVDARSIYSMLLPMAKKLAEAEYNDSKIMIDQAGLLSLFTQGTVIDIYGLGTQRYAAVHGDMDSVGRLIRNDKPTYYLDTAWYEHIFENENVELQEILSIKNHHRMKTDKFATFPKEMSLYKVIYK